MGASLDAIKAQQEATDAKTKEMMDGVHKMMIQKIAATSSKMKNQALEDKSLPITAVVDSSEKYKFKVQEAPPKDISSGLSDLLSGDFLDGLNKLISVALKEFLGDTSAGEKDQTDFHIVFANNSLLRLDYMIYKYQFSSDGLLKEYQNAFCYYMQVAVLDMTKVSSQTLLYELTKAVGEENLPEAQKRLQALGEFAKTLFATIHDIGASAVTNEGTSRGNGGGRPANEDEKEEEK